MSNVKAMSLYDPTTLPPYHPPTVDIGRMPIAYAQHAPGAGLADAVRCYWTIRGDASGTAPVVNRVLPDNCIDVIFNLRPAASFRAIVVGPMLTAEVLHHHALVDMLGVRFRPGAGTEFLECSATEVAAREFTAGELWSDAGGLIDRLLDTPVAARFAVLDAYLLRRRRTWRPATLARMATAAIERAHGLGSVRGLTMSLGISERKLQRTFEAAVGLGPKQVLRVQRFRAAASLVNAGRVASLSAIAATCGFADQAHMTREFVALAGVTPKEFRREKRLVGFVQD